MLCSLKEQLLHLPRASKIWESLVPRASWNSSSFFPKPCLVIHKFNGYNYVYSIWLLFSPHFGNYMFFKILYVHSTCMLMTGGNTTEESSSEVPQFTIYIASMPGQYTVSEWHVYMYLQSELFPCIRCSTLYILHCTHCKPIQHWSIL